MSRHTKKPAFKDFLGNKYIPILMLLLFSLVIGIIFLKDYAISVDEPALQEYASQSLDSYAHWVNPAQPILLGPTNHKYYGPAFLMIAELGYRLSSALGFHPDIYGTYHFFYFLLYLVGVFFFYLLCTRWFSTRVSLLASALFLTQPLLLGHAFINPKDTPFMSFFIISIYLGLRAVDSLPAGDLRGELFAIKTSISREFSLARKQDKLGFYILFGLFLIAGLFILFFPSILHALLEKIVDFFYQADPGTWIGKIFLRLAPNSDVNPVGNYVLKAWPIFSKLIATGFFIWLIIIIYKLGKIIPSMFLLLIPKNIKSFFKMTAEALVSPRIILAGILIGFTTSVRVLGPFALLIIVVIAWFRNPHRAMPMAVAGLIYACVASYLTWPYLWAAPTTHFTESLTVMSHFPWPGVTLFNGVFYPPTEIPPGYIPVLLGIQLTEPAIILFFFGLLMFLKGIRQNQHLLEMMILFILWFFLPVLYFVFSHTPMYHNFRQILFILPPVFFLPAIAIQKLQLKIKSTLIYLLFSFVCLLPGVISIIFLHPYEYIYYNEFSGGMEKASHKFETDYWGLSLKEMAEELNQIAPPYSLISIYGAPDVFRPYLHDNLGSISFVDGYFHIYKHFDYATLSSRYSEWNDPYPGTPTIWVVEREGAVLGEIRYLGDIIRLP